LISSKANNRGLDYRKASELWPVKGPMREILREPKPKLERELAPKLREILDHVGGDGGPLITIIRMDVIAHFLSRNGRRAMTGRGQKSK
jgi:hypothetical protein